MYLKSLVAWSAAVLCLAVIACERAADDPADAGNDAGSERVAMTSFYPLTYFAERIGGDDVVVRCPLPAGADPASWQPTADDIEAMHAADVVFVNGAHFEEWVDTAPLPRSRLVDTTASLADALLRYEHAVTHSHGTEGTHSHEGIDGHTWLDPVNAIAQAEAVRDGLSRAFPDSEDAFTQRCGALLVDLRQLDAELRELAPAMEDVTVVCSHTAYNYLARRYDWTIVNADFPPDEPIEVGELDELLADLAPLPSRRIVLWESEPLEANEGVFREQLGASSILFSPCESPSDSGDFVERMRANIERLRAAGDPGG